MDFNISIEGAILMGFFLRATIHEHPSSRRPRLADTCQAAADIGRPDLSQA